MIWKIRNRQLSCDHPLIMGILNLTPDSFSDGGRYVSAEQAIERALEMVQEGADILDLGAESTRPGAHFVDGKTELERILPILKTLLKRTSAVISIDTTKPEVAHACLLEGAHLINDVSGLKDSEGKMAEVIRSFGAGVVLMHRRGNPQTMQMLAEYQDVVQEVFDELNDSFALAIQAGIEAEQIVVDPGIGFAKTVEQNLEILRHLEKFQGWHRPVLVGHSRKSFIGTLTGRNVHEREIGTAAVSMMSLMKGARILRVHDVKSASDVIKIYEALRREEHVRSF